MRLSRKAGLLACGVLWVKYECDRTTKTEYSYSETGWLERGGGSVSDGDTMTGFLDYGFGIHQVSGGWSKYMYNAEGEKVTITAPDTGTVYRLSSSFSETITKEVWSRGTDGSINGKLYEKTISTHESTVTSYDIGGKIGSVRVSKGEYPDANNGYTYVTTDNGYIIMTDGYGNYFAYIKT